MTIRIPRYTLDGVTDAEVSTHPFATEDDLGLNLTRFRRAECDDVILLVHGLTSSSDLFVMPEHRNLAGYLLDDGFTDVWALDFRMSNRFPYDGETHNYTLDDIADYDHPAALRELRRHIGDRRVHVISHCLGSLSFMMSLFAGRLPGITSVTCNSRRASLLLRVPGWSRLKLRYGPPLLEYLMGVVSLDPAFSGSPPLTRGGALGRLVDLAHRECDVSACHMLSFMWGSGHPAMYEHANLLPETHERMGDLCGNPEAWDVLLPACQHDGAGRARGEIRPRRPAPPRPARGLPGGRRAADHAHAAADRGQQPGLRRLEHRLPPVALDGRAGPVYELEILPGYGHVDPIVGKDAHLDVFPRICQFLKRQAA